jgi:hypothetical protein
MSINSIDFCKLSMTFSAEISGQHGNGSQSEIFFIPNTPRILKPWPSYQLLIQGPIVRMRSLCSSTDWVLECRPWLCPGTIASWGDIKKRGKKRSEMSPPTPISLEDHDRHCLFFKSLEKRVKSAGLIMMGLQYETKRLYIDSVAKMTSS